MTAERSRNRLVRKLKDALGEMICRALEDPTVVEIMMNPDGRLYVERLGEAFVLLGRMDRVAVEIVIGSIAHAIGREVDEYNPIVSAELPIGGHRFEGLLPPVVASPSFSIRKKADRLIPLKDYVAVGVMSAGQATVLTQAVKARLNIVVSGGTGSGKTTLANALIAEITRHAPADRLVVLEDTAELRVLSENAITLRSTEDVDLARLLKSTMRLRPDRIIVGEVRDGAALSMLKAWNTGHPGGIATVHANSARAALMRLEQLTAEVSQQSMHAVIGDAVDLVVQIERTPAGRRVAELLNVVGHDGTAYKFATQDGVMRHAAA